MRKAAISAAAIFSAPVLAVCLWRIGPLLPERGGSTCFAADYAPPLPIDLSSPRRDQRRAGEVSSLRLRILLPPDERPFRDERAGRSYDWRYSLQLRAVLADGSRLSGEAICEWSDTLVGRLMPGLFCYIDCDGGSVTVWRQIGRHGVTARFEAGERLRTGGACGEGGAVFIGAEKETRSLPMAAVAQQICAE